MPRYRADYEVKSGLILPAGSREARLWTGDDGLEVILRNGALDEDGHVSGLIAVVIGEADSIDNVASHFRTILAEKLDNLAFVTRVKMRIEHCKRVIEWEPFQRERRLRPSAEFDPAYPPAPNLVPGLVETCNKLDHQATKRVSRPLQCFRYGLLAEQPEEQFHYFWLAFETLAELTKTDAKIPIICPDCKGPLTCQSCGKKPERRAVAADQMRALLLKGRPDGEEIYKVLNAVRNHLSHGRSPDTVLAKTGIELGAAVELMAMVVWHSIWDQLAPVGGGQVGAIDSVVNGQLLVISDITFKVSGEGEHPREDQIPEPTMKLQITFRNE